MRKLMAALAVAAITVAAPAVAQAAFPGQNGKLAFYAPVPDGPQSVHDQVFTINSDGTGVRQLTTDTGADSARAVWSPDGNTIAFDRFGDLQSQAELATMANDGTQVRALGHAGFAGGWAPDGRTIAFWYFGFSYDIYTIRSDGNGLTRVTNSSSQEGQPDWSPDGSEIAFASNFNTINSQNDIYTVKADLTEDAVQIVTAFGTDVSPEYSPDSSKILFSSNRAGTYDIWVMDRDGSHQTRLTTTADQDRDPEWAPDGSKIAFVRDTDFVGGEIYVMNADGSGQVPVTQGRNVTGLSDWQSVSNRPPDCSAVRATPASIWPPNHKLVAIALSGATDPDGDVATIRITGASGGTAGDVLLGPGSGEASLRAEKSLRGGTRVYQLAFTVSDGKGGTCTGTVSLPVSPPA